MNKKFNVGILGATGLVGQKFIALLENHSWFKVNEVVASEKSVDKIYKECVNWQEISNIPSNIQNMKIKKCFSNLESKILFSCISSPAAGIIEAYYAKHGHIVFSNAKDHRMDDFVPIIIPEINPEHINIVKKQYIDDNSSSSISNNNGYIITNSNCSVMMLAIAMFSIYKNFGIENMLVNTMQALSGAGYPGIPAMNILGNIIPNITGEEEKIQTEILKIFGKYEFDKIIPANIKISASCNRVPVHNGHTISVSFSTKKKVTHKEIVNSFLMLKNLNLPSSPKNVIQYFNHEDRPQPLIDSNIGNGMTVSVGRLRPCNVLDWKMTVLGHNVVRGAAGAAILNAEYLISRGWIK